MRQSISKTTLLCIITLMWGCKTSSDINIKGQFHGVSGQLIELEELSPGGSKIIDSTRTNVDGEFSFKILPSSKNPNFYNIRCKNSFVPLLLSPSEKVEVSAVGNIYNNYTVQGSEGSAKMRELSKLILTHAQSLDSLSKLYESTTDTDLMATYGRAYGAKYIQLKRSVIGFVMTNNTSMVSIVPLYQPILGSKFIFDDPMDIVYFRVVADSLSVRYPTSPYIISLQNDMKRVDNMFVMDSMLTASMKAERETLPEITLPDATGTNRTLSSTRGNVVLLEFTSYDNANLKLINQELKETYGKYKDEGFEIFQISVDRNKAAWINYILTTRLPWITVNDLNGVDGSAVAMFNVKKIPTRYLLNRQGEVVARDLYDDKLEEAIKKNL